MHCLQYCDGNEIDRKGVEVLQAKTRDRIWIEQIHLLQRQLPVIISTSFLASVIVAVGLRNYLALSFLITWISLVLVVAIVRLLHMQYWRRIPVSSDNVSALVRQFAFFSGVSGVLWGSFGIMSVLQDNPLVSVTTIMVLTGMVASATATLSHFKQAYLAFIIPVLLPTAIALLMFSEPLYYWIAVLIVLYLLVSIKFSRDIRATLIQSITLRFDNNALVDSLQEEKAHAVSLMELATRANFAKSRFLAAASHDLRQPLCALRLYTATLQMLENNDKQEEIARNIDTSVVALEELFDSLLDISKLDAGTLQVEKESFYLNAILDRIKVDFSAMAEEKGIALDIRTDQLVVHSDPQLLERLLRNLVSNAVRYTDEGSVQVRTIELGDSVCIEIRDTGCGISKIDQAQIFDEFVQLNNPARDRSKGIGLGLSIVKRLSELMEITVEVESTIKEGSVFSLIVPLGDETQPLNSKPDSLHRERYLGGLFVLVVDDEIAIQNAMTSILSKWGCRVFSAGSADEAFEALVEFDTPPDVAIVDLRLRSGESGLQVIEAIQDAFDDPVPSLILTGDIAADRLKEVQASNIPIMHKPCDVDSLYEFLHDIVIRN